MRTWSKRLLVVLASLGAVGAGSCTMVDSSLVKEDSEVACLEGNALGSYSLPKSYLKVTVWRRRDPETLVDYHKLQLDGLYTRPDRSRLYCLDYLASPTSIDAVRVWKNPDGLLARVTARAEDQTVEIAKKLIQTIFTLLVGFGGVEDPGGRAGADNVPWVDVFDAEFDPTDPASSQDVNKRLRDFGLCLISADDASSGIDPNRYCEHPRRRGSDDDEHGPKHRRNGSGDANDEESDRHVVGRGGRRDVQRGIFYRPRLPYQIFLFARDDRLVKGKWSLKRRAVVEIENHAPIISVGIDRTIFAKRATELVFDYGVLKDVRLYKTSEIQQAIEIPLAIVQHVALLPTNIIRFRIDQTQNEATLKRAQALLLKAQADRAKKDFSNISSYKGASNAILADPNAGRLLKGAAPSGVAP